MFKHKYLFHKIFPKECFHSKVLSNQVLNKESELSDESTGFPFAYRQYNLFSSNTRVTHELYTQVTSGFTVYYFLGSISSIQLILRFDQTASLKPETQNPEPPKFPGSVATL